MTILKLAILFGVTSCLAAGIGGPLGRGAAEALTGIPAEAAR